MFKSNYFVLVMLFQNTITRSFLRNLPICFFSIFCIFSFTGKPSLPADLAVHSVTATSIYLQWRVPNDIYYNYTMFSIYYQPLSNHALSKKGISGNTYFNITGLLPNTLYVIHVTTFNKFFEGDPSNQIVKKTRESGIQTILLAPQKFIFINEILTKLKYKIKLLKPFKQKLFRNLFHRQC